MPGIIPKQKKKKADIAALQSPFMRIPRMSVEGARDLLDLGMREIYQLNGRAPDALFDELCRRRPGIPRERLALLRLAVYFAETPDPDPSRLHPAAWQ